MIHSLDLFELREAEVNGEGKITPILSFEELKMAKHNPEIVEEFAYSLLNGILESCDGKIDDLPPNQQAGFGDILDSYVKFKEEDGRMAIPSQIFTRLEHNIYYNLTGLIDPIWLTENPEVKSK